MNYLSHHIKMVLCTFICTQVGAGLGIGVSSIFGNGGFANQVSLGLVFSLIFATMGFMLGAYSDFLVAKKVYSLF